MNITNGSTHLESVLETTQFKELLSCVNHVGPTNNEKELLTCFVEIGDLIGGHLTMVSLGV